MSLEVIGVRRVVVTMEAMQQVADIEVGAAGKTDVFNDMLLGRGPRMMMGSGDSEIQPREQALEDAILRVAHAGMPPDDVVEVQHLFLSHYKKTFDRG